MKKIFLIGVTALSTVALVACSSGDADSNATDTERSKTEVTAEAKKDDVPTEFKTAVTKSEQYLSTVYMSKEGLRTQLVDFEKFAQEAADYAVENVKVDWNEQAVKKSDNYLTTVFMSKEGLRTQLVDFEHFTQEEADYAVENVKVDWNQQALKKAEQYQETVAMAPEAIRGQLVDFDHFTQEQADYAIANLK